MDGKSAIRYSRNQGALSPQEQEQLLTASALVIGCGGLGGYVIEELTRIGVGQITVWDGDSFEESNLNRQLLSLNTNLGTRKAEAAAMRIAAINPAIKVEVIDRFFTGTADDQQIIARHQVVIDALDTVSSRLALAECCREMAVTLVHGAVGGWWGQVAVIRPGDFTLENIYLEVSANKGCEQTLGCLVMAVATVASLETAEAVKFLLGRPGLASGQLLLVDMLNSALQMVEVSPRLDTPEDAQ
ncbi:MAG: HesA/MoeB/ThiF family protein [Methylocystaceae bacterium]